MTASDQVRFHRSAHISGLELVTARYRRRAFPRHVHEEYVLGAMTEGAERLTIRGEEHAVRSGRLILIEPGEPHANCAIDENPFGYRVMYVPAALVRQFVADACARSPAGEVRFAGAVPHAPAIHRCLLRAHAALARGESRLEAESAFAHVLSALLEGGHLVEGRPAPASQRRVRDARDHIDRHFRDSISLRELAALTGTSAFHLLRSFRSQVGLPPAAYQTQLRIAEAKRLLQDGQSIAETAAELGFADQSHLTRHFQRIVGTTPGKYSAQ